MKMKYIENNDRPREKLILNGVNSLSNVELMAIMLASGTKEESVLDLSSRIINEYGFDRLFNMSYAELKSIKGIKEAKATRLMALFEIARRIMKNKKDKFQLDDSKAAYEYLKNEFQFLESEIVVLVLVNSQCEVIKVKKYNSDTSSAVLIPFRDIVNEAINYKAYGIFLAHNHPSGNVNPSKADIDVTKRMINLLRELSINFFDHLIISGDTYFSFSDSRILLKI